MEDCHDKCENNYLNDYKDSNGNPIDLCIVKKAGFGQKFLNRLGLTHSNGKNICHQVKEWDNRKGDEIFVPTFVNESILNNIIPTVKRKTKTANNGQYIPTSSNKE